MKLIGIEIQAKSKTNMQEYVLDTNVLLRSLVKDHPAHQKEAERVFRKGEKGEVDLVLLTVVIAETAFVLRSFYKQDPATIASALQVIVGQRWIHVEDRSILLSALDYYGRGKHFVDAYLQAFAEARKAEIVTFDQKLAKTNRP